MAIPRGFVFTCPACDVPIEMTTYGWQLAKAVDEDGTKGLGIQVAAWSDHSCHARNTS